MPAQVVRYLVVLFGEDPTFRHGEKKTAIIARLTPNVGAPSSKRREMLCGVIHSVNNSELIKKLCKNCKQDKINLIVKSF